MSHFAFLPSPKSSKATAIRGILAPNMVLRIANSKIQSIRIEKLCYNRQIEDNGIDGYGSSKIVHPPRFEWTSVIIRKDRDILLMCNHQISEIFSAVLRLRLTRKGRPNAPELL